MKHRKVLDKKEEEIKKLNELLNITENDKDKKFEELKDVKDQTVII